MVRLTWDLSAQLASFLYFDLAGMSKVGRRQTKFPARASGTRAQFVPWFLDDGKTADASKASTIDLTQDFLAQMLGTRRTTVTLVARALQAAGLIQYRRGKIEILDRPGLEEAACECYKIIRHETLPKIIGIDLKTR